MLANFARIHGVDAAVRIYGVEPETARALIAIQRIPLPARRESDSLSVK